MPVTLPDEIKRILDRCVFVHVSTLNRDGSPQSSVVWAERNGDLIRFSTTEDRIKAGNLDRDHRVAMSYTDPDDSYQAVSIQGQVISLKRNGTGLIERLADKYVGSERASEFISDGVRIDVTIAPERISAQV